jgi:Flp pilus assembly protein TadD
VLGCVYDWSEEWFAAENAYQRAIELDPGHRKAIQNLAALYQRQGLESKARELLIRLRRL